jgi:hypothetical protein
MQARFFLWLVSVCLLCLVNCGEGEKAGVGGDAGASTLEKSFQQVATQYKIPLRILKAVAYLESGVAAQPATAVYGAKNFGPARGETLFGLSAATLGLEGDPSERGVAEQLEAYGAWVNGHFANTGLPATTHNSDEIFNWIWQLAQLHYTGPHTKNVRVIFAKNILKWR